MSKMLKIAVSTPYPRVQVSAGGNHQPLVVVLTQAEITRARRAEFDRQTHRVVATMGQQPGLLGYSVRRQVWGNTVWTLTIWDNDESLTRFLHSPTHRRAVEQSGAAVHSMKSWRANLAPAQLPSSWAQAIAMCSGPG